jgi:hypothetical protein
MTDQEILIDTNVIVDDHQNDDSFIKGNNLLNNFSDNKLINYEIKNSITFEENVNISYLQKIVKHFDEVYPSIGKIKDHKKGYKVITDKKTVFTMLEKRLKHGNEFTYKTNGGRMVPDGYSCCFMNKILRHTIGSESNIDIDVDNCHPVLLSWYSKVKGWDCDNLDYYINNREDFLKIVGEFYEISRDDTKTKILSLINNENDKFNDDSPLYEFYEEIKILQNKVCNFRKDLYKKSKSKDPYNPKGKTMSLFLQEIENKICQCMIDYCKENNIRVTAPCYDGILVYKEDVDNVNELLNKIEFYIHDKLDIKVSLSEKIMNKSIVEILNDINDVVEDEKKIEFEYTANDDLFIANLDKKIDYNDFYSYDMLIGKIVLLEMVEKLINNTIIEYRDAGKKPCFITIKKDEDKYIRTFDVNYNGLKILFMKSVILKYEDAIKINPKSKESKWVSIKLIDIFDSMSYGNKIKWVDSICFEPYFLKKKYDYHRKMNLFEGFELLEDNKYMNYNFDQLKDIFENSGLYNHLTFYLCNNEPDLYNHLLDMIAHMIQCPNQKLDTATLIHSEQGNFKDGFYTFIKNLLNMEENYSIVYNGIDEFFKNFNKEQEGKLFIAINEISEGSSDSPAFKRHNEIKGRITTKKIRVEKKGVDSYWVKDFSRIVAFTNHEKTMMVENSDRRFVFIKANNEMCYNIRYFKPLFECIEDEDFLKMSFAYFAKRNLDNFSPHRGPDSKFKREQKLSCLSSSIQFLKDLWTAFDIDDKFKIHTCDLYTLYRKYCNDYGIKTIVKRITFVDNLKKIGVDQLYNSENEIYKFKYKKPDIESTTRNQNGYFEKTKLGHILFTRCEVADFYKSYMVGYEIDKEIVKTALEKYLRIENIDM